MRSGRSGIWVVLLALGVGVTLAIYAKYHQVVPPTASLPAPSVPGPAHQEPAAAPPAPAVPVGPRVLLKGHLILPAGEIPARKKMEVTKDNEACECPPGGGERQPFKLDESLVVDPETRGIAHAVVWVKGLTGGTPRLEADVDQRGCQFVPHVALLTPGGRIKLLNPDHIAHNYAAHSQVPGNPSQNLSVSKHAAQLLYPAAGGFAKPEFVRVTCDVHPWMQMWVAVVEGGYAAVTDAQGRFSIPGVPAGPVTLCVWQESLAASPREFPVTLGAEGGEVELPLK